MTHTSDQRTLQLVLQEDGDQVAVRWEDPLDETDDRQALGQYAISLDELESCAADLHKRLAALEKIDWTESDAYMDRIPCLQSLARSGARLYHVLMEGDPSDDKSVRGAAKFRDWFDKTVLTRKAEWRVQVVHKQYDAPVVPWGLVFTPPLDDDFSGLGAEWEDYGDFWAHSFKLGCRSILSKEADRLYTKMNGKTARVALTVKVDDQTIKNYHAAFPDHEAEVQARISTTVESFKNLPGENANHHLFWYVFLNERESDYVLGDREIDIELLRMIKNQIVETTGKMRRVLIMFFDGSALIRGDLGAIWVELMLSDGNSGVIAAETHIRNPQLDKFGWTFWKFILTCRETKLIDAIALGREKFWPQSLLYGVYCDPLNISFYPPPEAEIAKGDKFLSFIEKEMDDNTVAKAEA